VDHYLRLRAIVPGAVLSLDRRGDAVLGPLALTERPALWPARVIHLDLARVGARAGPDLAAIERLHSLSPGTALYAGGGVRSMEDLRALQHAGASGALIATALHDGSLSARDLSLYGGCSGS
jgi:phosphoribosylformimino-5-aminoimidazole carboxamide ribotide isomerase